MPDDISTPEQAPAKTAETSDFKPITSQEELNRLLGERIGRERAKYADYEDLKAKAAKYDEVEEKSKTETQKALERAEKAERERDELKLSTLKQQAAIEAGLPVHLASRLVGTNPEELAADAKALAESFAPPKPTGPKPTTAQSGSINTGGGDWLRDRLRN